MRALALILMIGLSISSYAQPSEFEEVVPVNGQSTVDLDLNYASNIQFETWDKNEVKVMVTVEINDGEHNEIFSMDSRTTSSTIYIEMDEDMWKKLPETRKKHYRCSFQSDINYKVFLPASMKVKANTISGSYELKYFGTELELETISGYIDMTVPKGENLDFSAETISGEVYSDIDITFPNGKEGLRQIVGQDFEGRINKGGSESKLKTISGNIYLRKG